MPLVSGFSGSQSTPDRRDGSSVCLSSMRGECRRAGRDRAESRVERMQSLGTKVKATHQITITDEYIETGQRIAIAQNKMLKFIYQTGWVHWILRALLAAIALLFLLAQMESTAALVCIALIMSFVGDWLGRQSLAKARQRVRFKGTVITVSMSDDGVDVAGASGNSHVVWPAILGTVIYPDGVLLKISRIVMIWLPDRGLIEGSAIEVRQLLAQKATESATSAI